MKKSSKKKDRRRSYRICMCQNKKKFKESYKNVLFFITLSIFFGIKRKRPMKKDKKGKLTVYCNAIFIQHKKLYIKKRNEAYF
jgi:hypothetical protein